MRVTISVTIPYITKLELCPLITAIFLISGAFSLQATRPFITGTLKSTLELAEMALPIVERSIKITGVQRQTNGSICGGSTNGCWGNYSILTDYDVSWPNTGVVREVCDIVSTRGSSANIFSTISQLPIPRAPQMESPSHVY